jgi:hypothetical protein
VKVTREFRSTVLTGASEGMREAIGIFLPGLGDRQLIARRLAEGSRV